MDDQHLDAYATVGAALAAKAVQTAYDKIVPCTTEDNACAAAFIDSLGQRAFRRPLSDAEKTRYLAFFDAAVTGGQFKRAWSLRYEVF